MVMMRNAHVADYLGMIDQFQKHDYLRKQQPIYIWYYIEI